MGKGYKGKNPRGGKKDTDVDAEAEFLSRRAGGEGGQSSNVGMLPPSDSDEEGEVKNQPAKQQQPQDKPAGQPKTAGMMPPSDSEDGDSESSDDEPEYLKAAPVKKPKDIPVERSAEDIRKEMERLEIIRKKREDDRKRRIVAEGWDRYAPVSETNKPPGHHVPSDHPSQKS